MNRRRFSVGVVSLIALPLVLQRVLAKQESEAVRIEKLIRSDEQWKQLLSPKQFHILRKGGTEPPFSSALNGEKRKGIYVCAACELPLFDSKMKFDSGTGWPSFFTSIAGHVETKLDFKLIVPRTEYHCARCGGHQGHLFKDGPPPTGERWCNNGIALTFIPARGQ